MFDSIEAVLVRRVNISRAHRAGPVLGETGGVCVCVCVLVAVYVTGYMVKRTLSVNLDHTARQ